MKLFSNNNSVVILLQLLSISINRNIIALDNNVDWREILFLAKKQGVRGLAYEALELLKQKNAACSSFPDRMTEIQRYAQTTIVEKMFAQHLAMA